jgi:4-hydroxy-4-methyl-2-oxoglutarate aldolase
MIETNAVSKFPKDFAARCRVLGTSTLYEASGLPCFVDPAIRPVWNGAFVAGPAYPLEVSGQ